MRKFGHSILMITCIMALCGCGTSGKEEVSTDLQNETQSESSVESEIVKQEDETVADANESTEEEVEVAEEPATETEVVTENPADVEEDVTEEPSEDQSESTNEDNSLALYNEVLQKYVSGEEMMSDEGEAYSYEYASNPGYALYDIDKNGTYEMFVTTRMDNEWRTYTIFYIKDGAAVYGGHFTDYDPKNDQWIYGFDFITEGYSFNAEDGFVEEWRLDWRFEDDPNSTSDMITYKGQETRPISEDEINELLSSEVREPEGLYWIHFDASTNLTLLAE